MRIIDKDIDSYTAFTEHHERRLRHCHPDEEAREKALLAAARKALAALEEYREVMDAPA
jgi:hypothetical protein